MSNSEEARIEEEREPDSFHLLAVRVFYSILRKIRVEDIKSEIVGRKEDGTPLMRVRYLDKDFVAEFWGETMARGTREIIEARKDNS